MTESSVFFSSQQLFPRSRVKIAWVIHVIQSTSFFFHSHSGRKIRCKRFSMYMGWCTWALSLQSEILCREKYSCLIHKPADEFILQTCIPTASTKPKWFSSIFICSIEMEARLLNRSERLRRVRICGITWRLLFLRRSMGVKMEYYHSMKMKYYHKNHAHLRHFMNTL